MLYFVSLFPQGISDGMSCAVTEARLAVDVGYWPLYRYTPETDLPSTTDEVSLHLRCSQLQPCQLRYHNARRWRSQDSSSMAYWAYSNSCLLCTFISTRHTCFFLPMQEGYVHLAQHGKLTLDSKKLKGELEDFLKKENRFNVLTRKNPEASARLHHHLQVGVHMYIRTRILCSHPMHWQHGQLCLWVPYFSPCVRDCSHWLWSPQHSAQCVMLLLCWCLQDDVAARQAKLIAKAEEGKRDEEARKAAKQPKQE